MPALLYEIAVALNELLVESGILAGIMRYVGTTAFAWLAVLAGLYSGLFTYISNDLLSLTFGALSLVWPYSSTWYGYINAVLPVYEMFTELVAVAAGYVLVIAIRWAKSVVPTLSN